MAIAFESWSLIYFMYNFFATPHHLQRKTKKLPRYSRRWVLLLLVGILTLTGCYALLRRAEEVKVIHVTL
ncbi:hypothetical protein BV378_08890 [Nostoc sp. RF31YmG]|nr:hypothetical protein BV378_08890 [Nostoc sp. RF31YmG]